MYVCMYVCLVYRSIAILDSDVSVVQHGVYCRGDIHCLLPRHTDQWRPAAWLSQPEGGRIRNYSRPLGALGALGGQRAFKARFRYSRNRVDRLEDLIERLPRSVVSVGHMTLFFLFASSQSRQCRAAYITLIIAVCGIIYLLLAASRHCG